MNRPRLKLGLDASRPTLNEAACARIGRELAVTRERRGLTIEKVGALLLLASCQVSALETVQLGAFYGAELYVAALKKYVALMGLNVADLDWALIRAPTLADVPSAFERGRKAIATSLAAMPKPSLRLVLGVAGLVSVVVGSVLLAAVRQRSVVPSTRVLGEERPYAPVDPGAPAVSSRHALPPTPTVAVPLGVVSSDVVRTPAAETISDDRDAVHAPAALAITTPAAPTPAVGRVRVGQPTWVFVRYADGTTLERVLGRGEELTLKERPTYLAVGPADETVVEIDGQAIDNSPFIVKGALRVDSSQLAQLVARR